MAAPPAEAPLVLVADDEAEVRQLVCDVLAEAGYRTLATDDGEAVLDLAVRHRPVLVVLDVMMPHTDGYTTLARLRGHPATKEIPAIILTGQAGPLYRTLSAGVGAAAHVTKPFSPRELAETVRRVLGHQAP